MTRFSIQLLTCLGIHITAQIDEIFFIGDAGQVQCFCPVTHPFARNALSFHVVIAHFQMLFEIRFGIFQTVLRFRSQHDDEATSSFSKSCAIGSTSF
jgi:hypothetical protein